MSAPSPQAAAEPWTKLELKTPSAVHLPRLRPPASVFLVTTAKSGPGMRMSTTATARNSPYFDHDMGLMLGPETRDLWAQKSVQITEMLSRNALDGKKLVKTVLRG